MLRSSTETLFENTDLTKVKDIEDIDNVLRPFIILPGISEKDRLLACYETLVYFADKIALPVKIGEKVESLNWPIIYEYIKTKLNIDLCDQWYQLSKDIRFKPISLKHSKVKSNKSKRWYTSISFDNEENAKLYLAYIKSLLLPKYQEQLAKISVQGNEKNGSTYTFTLPVEIYRDFEIRLYIWENEKQVKSPDRQSETDSELELESSGEEHGLREITHELPKNSRTSGKILTREERAKKIAYRLRTRGFWIKGLSEGPYDFTQSQVDNTTPKELNGQVAKRSRLRPKEHKRFSVLSDKIVDRQKEKTSRYKGMTQEELEIAKKQHSSPQSVTLVTPIAHPPVFRFKHINKTVIKSAGFIYAYKKENAEGKEEIKGLIHSRIYRDIATISRPLEFDDASEANKFHKAWDKGNRLLFETNEEFEQKVTDSHHNEELVRLYFDKDTDAAAIYCDNFESRCLAVLKARIQRKKLEEGNLIDPGYEVPILYYLPRHEKNLTPYTEAERQVDIQFANEIITKKNKKEFHPFDRFQFLIILPLIEYAH